MDISPISVMPAIPTSAALDRNDPKAAAAEFDAMVLELLLRQSGLLEALAGDEDAPAPFVSEFFLQGFAHELAKQMDLGFGSLLISQAQKAEGQDP
jgi:hypothetical protein